MSNIKFNNEQLEAINFHEGNCCVLAAPGAGKSTLLLERINRLITVHNVPPSDILTISFTRNTANELKSKLDAMGHTSVNSGTFHSICGRILFQEGIQLTPEKMVKDWQVDNCFRTIDQKANVDDIRSFISYQKNYMKDYTDKFVDKESDYDEAKLRQFYKAYEDMKRKNKLYDFDDYLIKCLEVLEADPKKHTYKFVLVDEHQDSNAIQNELLKYWTSIDSNLFVVGDEKQAIYGFNGGYIDQFLNFKADWKDAQILNVTTNYRSPKNVVDKANGFIRRYMGQFEHYKDVKPHIDDDGIIEISSYQSEVDEAKSVADQIEELITNGANLNEIAILYRLNKQSSYIEGELKERGIEYDIDNNSSFFKRKEISAIIAYMRLINDVNDDNAFDAVFRSRNHPFKFFSNALLTDMQNYASKNNVTLYEALQEISYPQPWQKKNAELFVNIIEQLKDKYKRSSGIGKAMISVIDAIVDAFQIEQAIHDRYKTPDEVEERLESINVLKTFIKMNNLEQFINFVYTSTEKKKTKKNAVRMLSVHKSKGLEFDNVFVVGVKDGDFPSRRAEDFNEESRLMYVAVTRTKQNMWISEIGKGNRFVTEYAPEYQ